MGVSEDYLRLALAAVSRHLFVAGKSRMVHRAWVGLVDVQTIVTCGVPEADGSALKAKLPSTIAAGLAKLYVSSAPSTEQ